MFVHHLDEGTGHPIVLVHGWGVDARRNWVDTGWVDALSEVRRVVAIDVRGHGRSDKPDTQAAYSYRAMSEDVLQVMDALRIERADFFGYSMGAFIGVSLLGRTPARFTRVVLGGIGDETESSAAAGPLIAAGLRADDPLTITDPLGRAYRAFVDADPANDRLALALAALQMWPEGHPLAVGGAGLMSAAVPVLIINGSEDHPYVDSAHRLASVLPAATLVTIAGADHLTTITDPATRTAVLEFLGVGTG